MLEEATRMFSIACFAASEQGFLVHSLRGSFQQAFEFLSYSLKYDFWSDRLAKADNTSVYVFLASISYLKLMVRTTKDAVSNPMTRDSLAHLSRQTRKLLITNLDTLPDPTVRGQHFDLCERLEFLLAETKLRKKDEHIVAQREEELEIGTSNIPHPSTHFYGTVRALLGLAAVTNSLHSVLDVSHNAKYSRCRCQKIQDTASSRK